MTDETKGRLLEYLNNVALVRGQNFDMERDYIGNEDDALERGAEYGEHYGRDEVAVYVAKLLGLKLEPKSDPWAWQYEEE